MALSEEELNELLEGVRGEKPSSPLAGTTTTTTPSTTVSPTRPSGPSLSEVAFPLRTQYSSRATSARRPGRLGRAISELEDAYLMAKKAGISVPPNMLPEYDPNTGRIDPMETSSPTVEEEDKPWWKDIASGVGKGIVGIVNVATIPQRIMLSTATEVAQAIPNPIAGETKYTKEDPASFRDWWNQIKDPNFTFLQAAGVKEPGQLTYSTLQMLGVEDEYGDRSKYKWADFVVGLAGDVATDPLTYMTFGGSAVAKVGVKAALIRASDDIAEVVVKEGVEGLVTRGASRQVAESLALNNDEWLRASNFLEQAKFSGDAASIERWSKIVAQNEQAVKNAVESVALEIVENGGRVAGGKVLAAENARVLAAQKWASAAPGAAKNAAAKELDLATQKVISLGKRKNIRRGYRAGSREDLAETVRQARQFAQEALANPSTLSLADKKLYEMTVDVLTDELIRDVAVKGWNAIRGDVGRILGTTGRSSIGVAGRRGFIPGSDVLTRALGTVAVKGRLAALGTSVGENILRYITPFGRRGVFSDDQVLAWRTALQSGKVTPKQAVLYTALLKAQKSSVVNATARTAAAGNALRNATMNLSAEDETAIRRLLESGYEGRRAIDPATGRAIPTTTRGVLDGVPISDDLENKFSIVKDLLNNWWREADSVVVANGGESLGRIPNFFPHSQTPEALRWAVANRANGAARVARDLGIDRDLLAYDNFVHRSLVEGSKWFGHTLTADDILGGVDRLNYLARNNTLGLTVDFDFFETGLRPALSGYAYRHARQMAALDAVLRLADEVSGIPDVIKRVPPIPADELQARVVDEWEQAKSILDVLSDPDLYKNLPSQEATDLQRYVFDLRNTASEIASDIFMDAEGYLVYKATDPDELLSRIAEIRSFADDLADVIAAIVRNPIDPDLLLNADVVTWASSLLKDTVGDLDSIIRGIDPQVWKTVIGAVEDDWKALRFGANDLMSLQMRTDVDDMFSNLRSTFTEGSGPKALMQFMDDYNAFFKTYATATVGFHLRNLFSNVFSLIAAGVNLVNSGKALEYYSLYSSANRARILKGRPLITPNEFINGLKNVSVSEKRILLEALSTADNAAGQFVESYAKPRAGYVGQLVDGGRVKTGINRLLGEEAVGISGRAVNPNLRFGTARRIAGSPLTASRALGSTLEQANRFILTYDGLKKGLDITEALARTNKYLFDYSDLSTLDKIMKNGFFPFWYWTSRILPLQAEILVTNPKVFSRVGQVQKNLREEDFTYVPEYLAERGAVPIGGRWIFSPDLGVGGAGTPNPLSAVPGGFFKELGGEQGAQRNAVLSLLSGMNPVWKQIGEQALNTQVFQRRDLVDPYSTVPPELQRAAYLGQQVGTPIPWLARILNITAGYQPENQLLQALTGLRPITEEGESAGSLARIEEDRDLARLLQYLGVPLRPLSEQEETREVQRRIRALEQLLAQERAKEEERRFGP